MAKVDLSKIPHSEILPYATDTQNIILWELKKRPRSVDELVSLTGMHKSTIYTQMDRMTHKKWIKVFDKNGNTTIYCRVAFIEQTEMFGRPLEKNPYAFQFGHDVTASLPEFIEVFGDPESKLRQSLDTCAGLLAHVWLRSYYRRIGMSGKQVEPTSRDAKKVFHEEVVRIRKLAQLLEDIEEAKFWNEMPNEEAVLLDSAPSFIRMFNRMAEAWRDTYKPTRSRKTK